LRKKKIVHRDLGARNLLVSQEDGKYVVKIADLGLSREVQEDFYDAKNSTFPVKWSPPEVIERRHFTSKSDVWSFGIVLWEIFMYGKIPYSSLSNSETVQFVLSGKRLDKPTICPEEVYKVMLQCWHIDPERRPSFKSLFDQLVLILRVVVQTGASISSSPPPGAADSQSVYHTPVITVNVNNVDANANANDNDNSSSEDESDSESSGSNSESENSQEDS